jgi:D-methionine transport system ATP-binding protein
MDTINSVDSANGTGSVDSANSVDSEKGASSAEPIIELTNIVKEFKAKSASHAASSSSGAQTRRALDDVSVTVNRGEIYGIIGYSGAGKSTLVRIINALERPTSGSVKVLGNDLNAMSESKLRPIRQQIGMIFQQFNLFSSKTVADNIRYPLILDHWRKDYQDARVEELLDFVGLSEHARKYPSQLSGGQKQRVGIARALATNPKILLADEATSALDPTTTGEVLELLKKVNRQLGITIVLITHQMNVVQQIADRVAVMDGGHIIERGSVYEVFAAPLENVTRHFIDTALESVPKRQYVDLLHMGHPGRLLTVLSRESEARRVDESGVEHVIPASGQHYSELLATHDIHTDLLFGGLTEVGGKQLGAITVEFTGSAEKLHEFFRELSLDADIIDFGTSAQPIDYDVAVSHVVPRGELQ